MADTASPSILVIKLSALGDFVLALRSLQAIRAHHPDAKITLLTTAPYGALAKATNCVDDIWLDERPPLWRPDRWMLLARRLRRAGFTRIYDLQRSDRSAGYFALLGSPKPEWVGVVAGCSHRYQPPRDRRLHIAEREAAQLALAGVTVAPYADLSFLRADLAGFDLPPAYALLVPGAAPHRPAKRWPAAAFAGLAQALAAQQVTPLLLGTAAERKAIDEIMAACPAARDLSGQTDFPEIAQLARGAWAAVGNDTGPMHLIAAAGAPSVVLFSAESDPEKVSPRGPSVQILQRPSLSDLPLEEVLASLPLRQNLPDANC